MSEQKKPRREALAPYRDAGLKDALIPLHRWDHRDEKGERGKSPRDAQWRRRMYSLEEIAAWAKGGGNVGFRIPPGIMVLDLDPRNVPPGRKIVDEFETFYGVRLADYPRVRTGSDGLHAYGRIPMGMRLRNAIDELPGIEFKALGRQVVTPGSIHPCGEYYEWLDGPELKDMPEWPAELLDAIKRPEAVAGAQEEISLAEAEGLLGALDPRDFQDHDRWLELMMAFHSATGGAAEAREYFAEWSTSDPDYTDHGPIIRERWDTLRAREDGVTIGTLYHRVVEKHGRVPPPPPEVAFSALKPETPGLAYIPQFQLNKQDGKPKRSRKNTQEALTALGVDLDFGYDEFKNRIVMRGSCECLKAFGGIGHVWDDDVAHALKSVLLSEMELDVTLDMVRGEVRAVALQNRFNELLEYFDCLRWDGQPRIDHWLSTYAGTPDNAYTRAVGRILLLGAVGRAYHPGIKFDTTVIFEGRQGVGKSRLLRILGGQWTLEGLSAKLDKDDVLRMQGHLIVELGEITALRNSELNDLKHFLSTEEDCVRPPYGQEPKVFPRRQIFVGTTNDSAYLKDMTGNRRFLPVEVLRVDHHAVEADRDLIWAEAIHEWRSVAARQHERGAPLHEALYLPERLWSVAAAEQEARRTEDPWEIWIAEQLEKTTETVLSTQGLLEGLVGMGVRGSTSPREIQRLGRIMAMYGWRKGKYRINGRPVSGFRKVDGPVEGEE